MPKRKHSTSVADRANPKVRGIHPDAVQAAISPSSRSECVDCGRLIPKGSARWGIKYTGNPLLGVPVVPLYGSHPMVMWCHPECGLKYQRQSNIDENDASRTCHLCSDTPELDSDGQQNIVKFLCGGQAKGKKIRSHAFHIGCWKNAIRSSTLTDHAKSCILDIDLADIKGWDDLSDIERNVVQSCWDVDISRNR